MKIKLFTKSLLALVTLVSFISFCINCTLEEENPTEARLDPGSLNSNPALEAAVAGMYRQFTAANQWGFCWIRAYGADDLTAHSAWNKQGYRDSDQMVLSSVSSRLFLSYNPFYTTINEANNIIANRENIEGTDETTNYFIGEAYFIRAFCYFHLTRTFGRVPMPLDNNITDNLELPKSEILEIYNQVESDFLMAESLLPDKYPGVPAAIRPNNGSARAYLAKLYMHWAGWPLKDTSKYAMAATSAKAVIDNSSTHGFALVPDMMTLWSISDENRFNSEIVFGVAHNATLSGRYSNRHTGRLGYPWPVRGWAEVFPEYTLFNEFPAGPRREATFRTEVTYRGNTFQWDELVDNQRGVNEVHPLYLKATGFLDEISTTNSATNMTTYSMRYADLLLYYAEATARSGDNSSDAWEALNKVRRRAYGHDINTSSSPVDLTSGDLAELAYTERKWELAGEFKRWDDLARMERVAEANANRSPLEPVGPILGDTSPANYFAPIPQGELDKSPHLID
ncbi:MAG: RagB/SusD family nutrient uptake outer membrane protein [Flavobacteriaceae bacterium]|nr:RagB/SusD family nutrient uptake outer membrane protein [Flavobacteriaceae bacterium]